MYESAAYVKVLIFSFFLLYAHFFQPSHGHLNDILPLCQPHRSPLIYRYNHPTVPVVVHPPPGSELGFRSPDLRLFPVASNARVGVARRYRKLCFLYINLPTPLRERRPGDSFFAIKSPPLNNQRGPEKRWASSEQAGGEQRSASRVRSPPEPRHPSGALAIVIICYKIKHFRLMVILYWQIRDGEFG